MMRQGRPSPSGKWRIFRFVGIAIVLCALAAAIAVLREARRVSRAEPCDIAGGTWEDSSDRCFLRVCSGKSGEQISTEHTGYPCFVVMSAEMRERAATLPK